MLNFLHSPDRVDLVLFTNALPPDAVLPPYLPTRVRLFPYIPADITLDDSLRIPLRPMQRAIRRGTVGRSMLNLFEKFNLTKTVYRYWPNRPMRILFESCIITFTVRLRS